MNLKETVTSKMLSSFVYFVMVASMKYILASAERTLDTDIKGNAMCNESFLTEINTCMDPFTKNVNFYVTTKPKNPMVYKIFVKYVCRRYEKMLLCVHTVLSNCPTINNIQIVQNRLSISWALEINQMCNIHSNNPTDSAANNKTKSYKETEAAVDRNSEDNTNINKDSLDMDYNRLLLPPHKLNDIDFKHFLSETISQTHSSNERHKTIPLSSSSGIKDNSKIISNLNTIEKNEKLLLQSGQSEIITTVIKYKSYPRNWLSWVLTQSLVPSKSNDKLTQNFNGPKKSASLLELIQVNVISNFNPNQIPYIANSAPEQAYFQTASAAKSLILQGHVSWHVILFLALGNIFILFVS